MRKSELIILLSVLFLVGCREEFEDITISTNPNNIPFITAATNIRGVVIDPVGRVLEGVVVSSSGLGSTITDENGVFYLSSDEANGNGVSLTFSQGGETVQRRLIVPGANTSYYEIFEIPSSTSGSINAASGGNFSLDNGAELIVPPNAAIVNGSAYAGDIFVRMIHYAPESQQQMLQSPGNFMANVDNEIRVLESYGMIDVRLETPEGQSVYFDEGNPAELFFPLDEATTSIAPEAIDFWQFIEGSWDLSNLGGEPALLNANRYRARITTGGTYNCDIPAEAVRLCGRLLDANGVPLPHEIFVIRVVGGMALNAARTDCMGNFCAWAAKNTDLELVVLDPCSDEEFVYDLGSFSSNSAALGDITINLNYTLIPTQLVDCTTDSSIPLDQVGVWVDGVGFVSDYHAVNGEGQTTVSYGNCGDNAEKLIQAVSFDGFSSSQIERRDVNDNSPLELNVCNELDADEIFDLTINGESVAVEFLNHVIENRLGNIDYLVQARGTYDDRPMLVVFRFVDPVVGTYPSAGFTWSRISLFEASNPNNLALHYTGDASFELNITDVGPATSYLEGNYSFSARVFETASQMTIATDIPVSVNFRLNL